MKTFLEQHTIPVRQDFLIEKVMKKAKYDTAGVRSGTVSLKRGWQVNIRSEYGTQYSEAR
jgi:hypothetical protein